MITKSQTVHFIFFHYFSFSESLIICVLRCKSEIKLSIYVCVQDKKSVVNTKLS